jgi:hypothetical protein
MRLLGTIARVQIQRLSLKTGEKPNRVYDPTPILAVDALTLNVRGAIVRAREGEPLYDIHHADHPHSKNDNMTNTFSIGFTSHYEAMRAEFGDHMFTGCAGENIIIKTTERITLEMLGQKLAVTSPLTKRTNYIGSFAVAHPCKPFSAFALKTTESNVKEALQFLDDGMRGFYFGLAGGPFIVNLGDEVYYPD